MNYWNFVSSMQYHIFVNAGFTILFTCYRRSSNKLLWFLEMAEHHDAQATLNLARNIVRKLQDIMHPGDMGDWHMIKSKWKWNIFWKLKENTKSTIFIGWFVDWGRFMQVDLLYECQFTHRWYSFIHNTSVTYYS